MKEVKFYDWVFLVDYEKTLSAYQSVKQGGSSDCSCGDCKNFLTKQDTIYPNQVLDLFKECGIDYKKDEEITTINDFQNGKTLIIIYFDFFGEILCKGSSHCSILDNFKLQNIETGYSIIFKTNENIVKMIFLKL